VTAQNTPWDERSILDCIKQDLLLDRLELADMGFTMETIADDALLLDETGLGLDSVDALDLLVGVERTFGFKFGEINKELIENTCRSLADLTRHIQLRLAQPVNS